MAKTLLFRTRHTSALAHWTATLVGSLAAVLYSLAMAQTADRPQWKVGDKWVFRAKGGLPAVETVWSRRVSKQLDGDRFEVTAADGRKLIFDNQATSLDKRGPEYSWHPFDFPLYVGKEWKHRRKIAGDTFQGYESSTWRVAAYEPITVPAGTFDCFRLEGEVWHNWVDSMSMNQSTNQAHTLTTNWYCPAVSWIAKIDERTRVYVGRPYIDSGSELLSFSSPGVSPNPVSPK